MRLMHVWKMEHGLELQSNIRTQMVHGHTTQQHYALRQSNVHNYELQL